MPIGTGYQPSTRWSATRFTRPGGFPDLLIAVRLRRVGAGSGLLQPNLFDACTLAARRTPTARTRLEVGDDWPPASVEILRAVGQGDGTAQLDSIPWFVRGIACGPM